MTCMPASRRARATTLMPRSWPSRPTLASTTRMGGVGSWIMSLVRSEETHLITTNSKIRQHVRQASTSWSAEKTAPLLRLR